MDEQTIYCEVDEDGVRVAMPDDTVCVVLWDDLQSVRIRTTDEGPFENDFFWLLEGAGGHVCTIPQEAAGADDLLPRLQELPGFDNEAVIAASGSADNREFLCWQRP